jgi:thiamine kinase-like enzyme
MLRDAGYDPVEICWAYPSHNYPRFFGELYDPGSYFFFSRWASLAHRDLSLEERFFTEAVAKMPRFILKQIMPLVWPRFLIFAWKDFKPKTFQNEVSKLTRTRSTVCLSGGSSPYSKVTFVGLQSGKPVSFSKFDRRFPSDSEKLLSQENLARQYAGVQYARHNMFGTEVFVEKPLKGRHVNPYDFDESLAAVKWLFDFQDRTVSRTSFDDSDSVIRKVSQHCSPSKAKELREHIKGFFDLCTDLDISSCAEHGDFWSGNILIDATTVYVLDWEFYRKVGNPIFDFCFFLIANARHDHKLFEEGRRDHKLFEENLFGGTSYSIVVSKLVRYFCRRRKLPQEVVWRGVPYALARSVARASIYSDTPSSRCYYFLKLMDAWFNRSSRSEHLWVNGPAEI